MLLQKLKHYIGPYMEVSKVARLPQSRIVFVWELGRRGVQGCKFFVVGDLLYGTHSVSSVVLGT